VTETMRKIVEERLAEVHSRTRVVGRPLPEIIREEIDMLEALLLALADRIDKLEGSGR
jgi:hypothetical protein